MSGLEWYPRNSRKALDGMRRLTLEQRGAYNTLLDLIYDRGEAVPDDDRWLAGQMGVSVRRWRQLRAALVEAGRIIARVDRKGPVLSDEKAEQEIEIQAVRRRVNAESGAKGGRKSAAVRSASSENNDIAEATASASLKLETETVEKISDANASSSGKPCSPAVTKADVQAVWRETPAKGRERSGQTELEAALRAAAKRGHAVAAIRPALRRYYASDEATRSDCQFAKGVHRMVEKDRWRTWAEPEAPTVADWPESRWRAAVEHFAERAGWSDACGPKPGEPRCRAPPNVLAEFGFHVTEVAAA